MEKIEEQQHDRTVFGFWVYLMTDLLMFAVLFATYAVLRNNSFGGPTGRELFALPFALTETIILLTSSFTMGLAHIAADRFDKKTATTWLTATLILGASFLTMELTEFVHLAKEGNTWHSNSFLSSFFTLVGTHGLHITLGMLWITTMLIYIHRKGLTPSALRKFGSLSLFWHFLEIIWIFIFTFVYLTSAT